MSDVRQECLTYELGEDDMPWRFIIIGLLALILVGPALPEAPAAAFFENKELLEFVLKQSARSSLIAVP